MQHMRSQTGHIKCHKYDTKKYSHTIFRHTQSYHLCTIAFLLVIIAIETRFVLRRMLQWHGIVPTANMSQRVEIAEPAKQNSNKHELDLKVTVNANGLQIRRSQQQHLEGDVQEIDAANQHQIDRVVGIQQLGNPEAITREQEYPGNDDIAAGSIGRHSARAADQIQAEQIEQEDDKDEDIKRDGERLRETRRIKRNRSG
mmetsp:Transcript_54787/g.87539  ORF Transcript_54787/g.87539 Transcript_54787/m.87539 type:complete len:200 (+) Transcript_54787:70-669(+)